jgi:hypothetical protein
MIDRLREVPLSDLASGSTQPTLRWIHRLAWGVAGLGWVAWIGLEDRGLTAVVLLAASLCAASGLSAWVRWRRKDTRLPPAWLRGALVGLVAGGCVGPTAALLILLKTSLHAHPVPDFSAADLGRLLSVSPFWVAAGLAAGLALGLLAQELSRRPSSESIAGLQSVAYNREAGGVNDMPGFYEIEVFLCPRCLDSQASAGVCPRCGLERVGCRPGEPDDPCRRPLIDAAGHIRTRAPLWWLRRTVGPLTRFLDSGTERSA